MSQTTVNLKASQEKLHGDALPYITELRRSDVLLGRGASIDRFVGNVRFRQLVKERKVEYSTSTLADGKNRIAHEIIANVQSSNGRFLRAVDVANTVGTESKRTTKAWIQVSIEAAMVKVKQALRDCCIGLDTIEQNQPPRENSDGVAAAIRRSSIPTDSDAIMEDAASAIQPSQWNQRPRQDMTSSTSQEQYPSNVLHPILLSLMQTSHHHPQSSSRNSLSEVVAPAMVSLYTSQLSQQQSNSPNSIMAVPYSRYEDGSRNSALSSEHAMLPPAEDPTLSTELARIQRELAQIAHRRSQLPSNSHQQPSSYIPISDAVVEHPAMATLDAILLSQPQSNAMDSLIRYIHGFNGNSSSAPEPTILSPLPAPPPDNFALSNQLAHLQQQLAALSHRHPPPHLYEPALNFLSNVAAAAPTAVTTNTLSASQWREIPAVYVHRLIPLMREPSGPSFTGADLDVLLRAKHQAEAAQDFGCLLQIRQVLESVVLSPHIRRELRLPELQMLCTILQGMLSSV